MTRVLGVRIFALALAAAVSIAGIAVFAGLYRGISTSGLVAEVRLQSFELPAGFGIEPQQLASNLVTELQNRAAKDVALEVILGKDGARQMREVVLPRLVNSDLMARMVNNIPALATLIAIADYRTLAEIEISNHREGELIDLALTLPGVRLAQVGADTLEIADESKLTAIRLGSLAAGDSILLRAWLDEPFDALGNFESQIRVGARGIDGSVLIYGHRGWAGEDFETVVWGRWAVWAVLTMVAVASLGLLTATVVSAIRRPRATRSGKA